MRHRFLALGTLLVLSLSAGPLLRLPPVAPPADDRMVPLLANTAWGADAPSSVELAERWMEPTGAVGWAWGAVGLHGHLDRHPTRGLPESLSRLPSVQALAGGMAHLLALTIDGTVWEHQEPRGSEPCQDAQIPTCPFAWYPVSELDRVVAIAAGSDHSLALRADGTVWAWGSNAFGQLGDGTFETRPAPRPVAGLSEVQAISGGSAHSLALRADGTVWAWGMGLSGRLGHGAEESQPTPLPVVGLTNITAIAAGLHSSFAVDQAGTVWAWGVHLHEPGTWYPTSLTPVPVAGLPPVVAVAAGTLHALALDQAGQVWSWGYNEFGELGHPGFRYSRDESTSHAPAHVEGLDQVVSVAAGHYHSLALTQDGTVWAWGSNIYRQLGRRSLHHPVFRSYPEPVPSLSGVSAISAAGTLSLAVQPAVVRSLAAPRFQ